MLPSIVYLHRDGNRAAGREAIEQFLVTGSRRTQCVRCELVEWFDGGGSSDCRQYRLGGDCLDARLIAGLKSELSQIEPGRTHSWAVDFELADLVAVILRRLKTTADRFTGADVRRVVLGHPVVFAGAEGPDYPRRQAAAEERLRQAALTAGFEEVEFLAEPAAVIERSLKKGVAVAVDFGGGTFDVAVLRFWPDHGEAVALVGAAVGGEQFDRRLFEAKVAPVLHLEGAFECPPGVPSQLPNWFRAGLATLSGIRSLLSDSRTSLTLQRFGAAGAGRRLEAVAELLYGGHAYGFYRAIEDAKIALSTQDQTSIEFHRPRLDLSIPVARAEFEDLIADQLQEVQTKILQALKQARIGPDEVDLVLRTGGSSSIPAFVRLLEEIFDPSIVESRPVYTTVAHGLASHAQEVWR